MTKQSCTLYIFLAFEKTEINAGAPLLSEKGLGSTEVPCTLQYSTVHTPLFAEPLLPLWSTSHPAKRGKEERH